THRILSLGLILFILLFPVLAGAEPLQEESKEKRHLAEQLYNTGYLLTMLGRYEEAIRLFQKSLKIELTAEAYTYLGWAYSHMGDYQRAIEEAEKAIRIDPEFGNPYNDIGVYLMELGREDEAIPYLERAMHAKRYCCYQFPHYNMGRIYLKKKMYGKAREEFKKSLAIDPDYAPAREALNLLQEFGVKDI
ncbi:MAG: tetratricopeptide repeat protein, partial [Candidatus Binatia bacterium]